MGCDLCWAMLDAGLGRLVGLVFARCYVSGPLESGTGEFGDKRMGGDWGCGVV